MVLDIILTVAAALAAAFAGWQAWIARGARRDAKASETAAATSATDAAATAKESAAAMARSAAALERSNDLVEESRKPVVEVRWLVQRTGEIIFHFINEGNTIAHGVTVEEVQDDKGWLRESDDKFPRDVEPGHSFELIVVKAMNSPTVILRLKWREMVDGELGDLKYHDTSII